MDRLREEIDERTGELEHANQEAAAKDPRLAQEDMGRVLQYLLDKEPDAGLRG